MTGAEVALPLAFFLGAIAASVALAFVVSFFSGGR